MDMTRAAVCDTLRRHEPELRSSGVVHIRVYGSVARGEETPASDVDLLAEFDGSRLYSLLDRVALERRLTEILGVSVDLSPETALKKPVRQKAAVESVLVF